MLICKSFWLGSLVGCCNPTGSLLRSFPGSCTLLLGQLQQATFLFPIVLGTVETCLLQKLWKYSKLRFSKMFIDEKAIWDMVLKDAPLIPVLFVGALLIFCWPLWPDVFFSQDNFSLLNLGDCGVLVLRHGDLVRLMPSWCLSSTSPKSCTLIVFQAGCGDEFPIYWQSIEVLKSQSSKHEEDIICATLSL